MDKKIKIRVEWIWLNCVTIRKLTKYSKLNVFINLGSWPDRKDKDIAKRKRHNPLL